MRQTAVGINGQDCTSGDGNTAAELEAIAVTLLRAAEGVRNREEGILECVALDGHALAFVHLHDCGMTCELESSVLENAETPSLEKVICVSRFGRIPCDDALDDRSVSKDLRKIDLIDSG